MKYIEFISELKRDGKYEDYITTNLEIILDKECFITGIDYKKEDDNRAKKIKKFYTKFYYNKVEKWFDEKLEDYKNEELNFDKSILMDVHMKQKIKEHIKYLKMDGFSLFKRKMILYCTKELGYYDC